MLQPFIQKGVRRSIFDETSNERGASLSGTRLLRDQGMFCGINGRCPYAATA